MFKDKKETLLIDLLGDISDLSEEGGLEQVATSEKSLRPVTVKNVEEMVSFQNVGKRFMIYSSNVNPCVYIAATLKG